jgi:Pyruvate/2-oxoacid:ferredoxin oxidoreductase delta subunit
MKYKNIDVYYFTGTGNSLKVARWISEVARGKNLNCDIINIAKTNVHSLNSPAKETLVVFVSPVHGFNYPQVMLHFLYHFPKGKNDVILMNTRAGMRIGNWVTPGLSGLTFYLASAFLIIKGYKIKGMLPVDLPSNWISLHPGLNRKTIAFLHSKMEIRVIKNASIMIEGRKIFPFLLKEFIPDLVLSPVSLTYYFIGRFVFSKTFIAAENCSKCNKCIESCPVKAIRLVDGRPYWTYKCESCMRCMSICPEEAIQTSHGSFAVFAILMSILFEPLLYRLLEYFLINVQNELIKFVFETGSFLLLLSAWYRIIHYLMRYRFFNKLIVFTSLTKYKFWGRRYRA